jgi:signal transduction histidine kinase
MLISIAVVLAYATTGLIGGDRQLVTRAILPAVIAGFTYGQLRAGRARAAHLLSLCAPLLVIHVRVIDAPGQQEAAMLGLVMIGAAASVLIRRWRIAFFVAFSALITFAQVWGSAENETLGSSVGKGVTHAAAFLFVSWLILWARRHQETEEVRYEVLFARAPVSIWEEDYRAVGAWLDDLRRRGVEDLRGYLTGHPEEVVAAAMSIIVKDVNQATLDLLEVSEKDRLLGRLSADVITESSLRSFEDQFVAIWEDRDHLDTTLRGSTMNGNDIDGVLRWVVPREKGRLDLANVVIAMVDITELRRAERRLQDLVTSKDQFIASVSHELRTPLTAVVGLTDELRHHHASFSALETQEFMDLIADQAKDVANIVEDLLVAARADIGTITVATTEIDLAETARSVAEMLANGSRPEFMLPAEGQLLVVADQVRVRQILRNLLSNAHRYGGEQVAVRAGQNGSRVWIEVADNGSGVPHHEQERIFEPYETAHRVTGVTAAVGLGLTVSRQLARLMSGDLTYRYENGESVFRLSLPPAQ